MPDTQSASLSDIGKRRRNNEDFITYFEPVDPDELQNSGCLYIVADGVGGAAQGERASQFAAQKLLYEYYRQGDLDPVERLRQIIGQINESIHSYSVDHNTRMATTIVAAVVRNDQLYVANVGDSRVYLIRDGEARQLNRDHSLVGEMVAHRELTEAEALNSNVRNSLTRSLGGDPEVKVDVYPPMQLKPGDKILLCSDGLTRYALSEKISALVREGTVLVETARRLVQFANEQGGADNVSVVVVSYKGEESVTPVIPHPLPIAIPDLESELTVPDTSRINKRQGSGVVTMVILAILVVLMLIGAGWVVVPKIYGLISGTSQSTPIATPIALTSTPTGISTAITINLQPTQKSSESTPSTHPTDTLVPSITATTVPATPFQGQAPQQRNDDIQILSKTCQDGSTVAAGKVFTNNWVIVNTGTRPWNSSYYLKWTSTDYYPPGSSSTPVPSSYDFGAKTIPFNQNQNVPFGASETLTVPLMAPIQVGQYVVRWLPVNDAGVDFPNPNGSEILYIKVNVTVGGTDCALK